MARTYAGPRLSGTLPLTMLLQLPTEYDTTLGAAFVGCVIGAALYGISVSQAVVFFYSFPHERTLVKSSVVCVWLMDTLHTIFVGHVLYTLMVIHFGEPLVVILVPWSYWAGILVTTMGDTIVRLFFVYRLWKLSCRNLLICFPSIAITTVNLVAAIGLVTVGLLRVPNVFSLRHYSWLIYVSLSLVAVGDIWFAIWLIYYVRKTRSSTVDRDALSLINTALVYTINTGGLTAVLSVLVIVMYSRLSNTYLYIAFFIPLDKLYTNAMFATLNVRSWSQAGIDGAKVPIMTINGNLAIPVAFADPPPPEINIYVNEEVVKAS